MKRLVQNKKALSMALAAALAIAPVSAFAASNDIRGHWAERTITQWQDKGLIGGYQDGTFKPDKPATRAEFARIMNQALGLNHKGNVSFSDVSSRDWFYNDVAIAMGEQYTAGYPDGTFKPNEIITRAQAAVFIAKALGASGGSLASFKDASSIPAWAQGAVGGIVEKGYMSGYPDGTFRPNAVLTRAEAVSTLNRIMGVKPVEEETKKTEKDVVIDESGTKLKDQTIEGNLTISDKVGKGKVTLSNVEIKGDLIIQGGGENSVYLDNTVVEGKTVMDKKNVHLEVSGKTKLPNVEIKKACSMTTSNFSGEVKKISITSAISDKTTIGVSADKLYVEGKANLYITRDIAQVIVEKDAAGTELEISSNGKVSTLTADGKVALSGSGKISTLEANVDGITYTSAMTINKTETAKGVDKPSRTNESSSSSSSSSKTSVSAIGITGTAVVGAKLTATPTPAAATGTYQWQRCDTVNGTYTNITGATASTYTIATGDAGKYLRVVFSASGNYKGTQTSVATAAIGTAVVPSVKVTALAFTDTDTDAAQMGGTVTWTAPTNVSNVTGYVVYASTDGITKGAKLGEVGVGTNQLVIPANTTYAAHIIVVAKNITGEAVSANYASVAVTDVVADPAAGATSELAKVTDAVVTTVPNGTTNDKASIEAAMLVLANAAVDSANYTVTIASGSAYDAGTKAWTGKFVVTNKTTPANTKTDAANRNITVVIAADPAAGAT
ncbi:S-layer homology domain-containing protein, partial [Anaerotignum propionicum]